MLSGMLQKWCLDSLKTLSERRAGRSQESIQMDTVMNWKWCLDESEMMPFRRSLEVNPGSTLRSLCGKLICHFDIPLDVVPGSCNTFAGDFVWSFRGSCWDYFGIHTVSFRVRNDIVIAIGIDAEAIPECIREWIQKWMQNGSGKGPGMIPDEFGMN